MKSLPTWKNNTVFKFCAFFVWLIGVHGNLKQVAGNEAAHEGFISIDCGASRDYVDETTEIWYQTDENFIGSGTNHGISPVIGFSNDPNIERQLETLRSFPEGERNCYTLRPEQEKNQKYLIRAIFAYGNYDNENKVPVFDLYLGVNYWETVQMPNASYYKYYEIIQQLPTDIVQVCLVNTGQGTPFINILELRPLNNSVYSASLPSYILSRIDIGSGLPLTFTKYKDDEYDRIWVIYDFAIWDPIITTAKIRVGDTNYKLPQEVLRTAVQPLNHSNLLYQNWTSYDRHQYHVVLHFAEIQNLPPGHKRIINVTFGDNESISQPLEYLKPVTISSKNPTRGYATFTVQATAESDAPPILNAFEIHRLMPQPNSPTNAQDVIAIMEIKRTYRVSRINWHGDPCVPTNFAWDGLNCSSDKNPRIISLKLSSTKLTGHIAISFANLTKLEFLDLSNNELTGELPEFLADLPNLKFLNLTGNKLIGSIPTALREKANLQLRFYDGTQVAVKLLSASSKQGYKEFQSEVQLASIARHRNLVSLIGYCHQDDVKVLIYEYMGNGDLSRLLSEKNSNVLKWNERLQVAVDAAKGLDYLHNSCKTPIIHRDLKPSNILLNKSMVAKIADFGLSRVFKNEVDSHLSTQPAGTPGYIDPEFQRSGNLNKKSDIYSFGMILLQLITGHPPIRREYENICFILDWVRPKIECGDIQGIVDPKFAGEFNIISVQKALEMAMSCVFPDSTQRPDISDVYHELKACLALEMDHAADRSTPSSSLSYTGNFDSTTLSGR